jgi:CheY-like chemotaxis protein
MNYLKAKHILIVDDNPSVCSMLKRLLESQGYRAYVVHNGLEAIQAIRQGKFDLILLDLMLPEVDGHKICRLVKFDPKTKNIPVIVLTSRNTIEDKKLAKQCGADAFIVKTTSTFKILDIIEQVLVQYAQV